MHDSEGRPTVGHLNMREQMKKWTRLPAFGGNGSRLRHAELEVRRRRDGSTSGHAWSYGRIVVSVGLVTEGAALGLLIHEMAHVAAPGQHHNKKFKQLEITATRQACPGIDLGEIKAKYPAYQVHEHCKAAINRWVNSYRERGETPPRVVTQPGD
jgi:hypothetical protein